jgi:alpha,alpha-trehalose-phosphate synthase [UDP-forming]
MTVKGRPGSGGKDVSAGVDERRRLLVVSNREPYVHAHGPEGTVVCTPTAGGVATALDALMRERGGVWIAHGSGDADRGAVDEHDRVWVPPDAPSYQVRRLWISDEEFAGYYGGFANEGLWPLCHIVHVRPVFRQGDWQHYQSVNGQFAEAIHQELRDPQSPVFIQDYHLALVASRLRAHRPEARTAFFWHIPWPNQDRIRICPWRRELLEGLLANDLIAFQLPRDQRNFLLAIEDEFSVGAGEDGVVSHEGRQTQVISVPIGVDFARIQEIARSPALHRETERLKREMRLDTRIVGVGVDRLDYTKGIPERLTALDLVLERRPELAEQLTFVQVGVPSRSELESYGTIEREIDEQVEQINAKYTREGRPGPIRYCKSALELPDLVALFRMAAFCIVSSLHDGMNLVAKEFVAARDDLDGVLVLSELAGAANELGAALIINPYEVDGFASAIEQALDMPPGERMQRMRTLRRLVAGRDVFSWAADILEGLDAHAPDETGSNEEGRRVAT